jgi:hypothetical protein
MFFSRVLRGGASRQAHNDSVNVGAVHICDDFRGSELVKTKERRLDDNLEEESCGRRDHVGSHRADSVVDQQGYQQSARVINLGFARAS